MSGEPLLAVRGVSKTFGRAAVVRDVSFTLDAGRSMAIVGPSGSGKTTLARCIAGREKPTSGEVRCTGTPQLIAQQPASTLNPRFTAAEVVEEPLVIHGVGQERRQMAIDAMRLVGLPDAGIDRCSQEFSGGEKQRMAIARAMVVRPQLIVLDESLTGLDPALQAQMTELLLDLQRRIGVAYILITHDLALASAMAGSIAVMHQGEMVEQAPTAELLARPRHPLTRELIQATRALTV